MKALGMEDSPVKIYGWIQNSYTGNTNGKPPSGENFGVIPNHRANSWMGNQYYLIVEKPVEQNDEINFGFRVDNLFGNDWPYTNMTGLFDDAFDRPENHFAGVDLAQFYGEVHLPDPTGGPRAIDVKGGRWYTLAGYEVGPAIGRPLLSVPYMFNYGQPFTHFGALTHLAPDRPAQPLQRRDQRLGPLDQPELQVGLHRRLQLDLQRGQDRSDGLHDPGPEPVPVQPVGRTPRSSRTVSAPGTSAAGRNRFVPPEQPLADGVRRPDPQVDRQADPGHRGRPRLRERTSPSCRRRRPADAEWYGFGNWFLYSSPTS